MNLEQMREILATVASFDGRSIDRRVIEDWHAAIGALSPDLALAAVRAWYTENSGYIQPRNVLDAAARIAGYDRPDSVTARRLEGRPLPFGDEPLAAPLNIERKAIK